MRDLLTVFAAVLAIVLLVTTFAWAIIVMHNFGQGLKGRGVFLLTARN